MIPGRLLAFTVAIAIASFAQSSSARAADCWPQIRKLIAEHLGVEPAKVTRRRTFEQLGADGLDRVEIIMMLEEEFEIEIADDVAEELISVEATIAYVNRQSKKCR